MKAPSYPPYHNGWKPISPVSGYGLVFGHSNNKTHKGKEHFPVSSRPPTLQIVLPLIQDSVSSSVKWKCVWMTLEISSISNSLRIEKKNVMGQEGQIEVLYVKSRGYLTL